MEKGWRMNRERVNDNSEQYAGEDLGYIFFALIIVILVIAVCIFS